MEKSSIECETSQCVIFKEHFGSLNFDTKDYEGDNVIDVTTVI